LAAVAATHLAVASVASCTSRTSQVDSDEWVSVALHAIEQTRPQA
jgi:hypothetical protein